MTIRRALWRTSSILGDLSAARRGPGAVGKRLVRKAAYRRTGGWIRRLLK